MGEKLDRGMYYISMTMIMLPVFIFLVGWLRLAVAIPAGIVFLVSLYLSLKNRPLPPDWRLGMEQWKIVLVALLMLGGWVLLSGQGGFCFQNPDYHYRNAIFRDLIEKPWPVVYDYSAGADPAVLTYYIAFWLPGALVGKLAGWHAANLFLFLWAFLGVLLVTYYLFRTLRRASLWSVVILIFFSGLDIIGVLLLWPGFVPSPIGHIEWWAGIQYSSDTTLLFWVFNQSVMIWLAILLILNMENSRSLFFLYASLLLHGPFPFLGMLPIVLWKAYQGDSLIFRGHGWIKSAVLWGWRGIRRAISFENLCGGGTVLVISYLYLSNNISAGKSGVGTISTDFILFFTLEFGLYWIFLFKDCHRNPLYWLSLVSLLLIPFFRVGGGQDFCMRVSIPMLFMIQIMIQKTLLGKKRESRIIQGFLAVFLTIGAIVPAQEMLRSIVYTLPVYCGIGMSPDSVETKIATRWMRKAPPISLSTPMPNRDGRTWADDVKTLGKDRSRVFNFIGPLGDGAFIRYMLRKRNDAEFSEVDDK